MDTVALNQALADAEREEREAGEWLVHIQGQVDRLERHLALALERVAAAKKIADTARAAAQEAVAPATE